MLLAGDIGGTKTHLALFERREEWLYRLREKRYVSGAYGSFDAVLTEFLSEGPAGAIEAACFGVAGPVADGIVETTNLPWRIQADALASLIGCAGTSLLNDLEAAAFGMLRLEENETAELNPDADRGARGNIAVIAAGTGTGEAMLYWDGGRYHAIATEGGHCDFGPADEQQEALLRFLRQRYGGHVSYERLLSGEGLYNIYSFLKQNGYAPEMAALDERGEEPGVAISRLALESRDALCVEALRIFVRIYGAEAGNLALKSLSRGGVFIGGGIARKILPALRQGEFMRGFLDKGRFASMLKKWPVKVVTHPDTALIGAAWYAAEGLG